MTDNNDLLKEILAGSPSSETFLAILARIKESGNHKKIIHECLKALEIYPRNIQIKKFLAEAYFEDGQILEAEAELKKVIHGIEELISSYLLQAKILNRQEKNEEAIELLELFLAHCPQDQEASTLMESLSSKKDKVSFEPSEIATPTLAEIFFNQGKTEKAIEIYGKILLKNPDDIRSRKRLDEISSLVSVDKPEETYEKNKTRQKTERMITALESWLEGIRKDAGKGLSVS